MGYQVLARKYRPQRFSDVYGQDHVTRTLTNALTQNRIAHGYIFSGHRGIGKTTIARILAMALDCRIEVGSDKRPTVEPCLQCVSCREISSGSNGSEMATHSFDFIEIDAASNRGIDDVRSIISQAEVRPARDKYKIFLLDEAHQITDAAFNAILKTLEEPPDWVIFMMATTEPESIPQTIRSRCQHFSFHAVKFDDILAQLRAIALAEGVTADEAALALLAEAGDGSMRDALSIMDQAIASAPLVDGKAGLQPVLQHDQIRDLMGSVPNTVFERLMEHVSAQNSAALMEDLDRLITSGNSPSALARQLVRYLRNCLMAKLGGEHTQLLAIANDERSRAARTALLFSEDELTRNLQLALRTFDELNYRQEQRFHLELGLLKLIQAQRLLPMEEILSGLASNPGALGNAPRRPTPSAAPAPRPTPPRPPAPATPSLSPFAASNQRTIEQAGQGFSPVTQSAQGFSPVILPPPPMGALAPEATSSLTSVKPVPASDSTAVGLLELDEVSTESTNEPVELIELGEPVREIIPAISASATTDSDHLRQAVAESLAANGHSTAATLLSDARWLLEPSSVRIEVNAKPTMIRLTFNAAAEKLIRAALTQAGAPSRFLIVPGEGLTSSGTAAKPAAPQGSIEAEARANPLVLHAQSLFNAEIVSVVDLRT